MKAFAWRVARTTAVIGAALAIWESAYAMRLLDPRIFGSPSLAGVHFQFGVVARSE